MCRSATVNGNRHSRPDEAIGFIAHSAGAVHVSVLTVVLQWLFDVQYSTRRRARY